MCCILEEQAYFEEQIHVLRQHMDAEQFKKIWNSGRALTMEQALQFALGENTGKQIASTCAA